MAAENKKTAQRREDYLTNRVLAVFTLAFVLILGLMGAYRLYSRVETMFVIRKVLYVLAAVFAAGTVAGILWERFGKKREYKVVCGKNVALGCAIVAVCAFCCAALTTSGVKMMYVFVPVASALILIYLLYPHDFFLMSLVCACGAVLLWYLSRSIADGFVVGRFFQFDLAIACLIAAFVLLAAYACAVKLVEKNNGTVKIGSKTFEVMPKTTKYFLSYITAGVTAACLIAGFICGATVAYYLVFVMVAYLLILAVYYTVKML